MRPIPPKTKEELANDPYMKKCCLCGSSSGKIDWHHNLIFKSRQSDIKETILPLCQDCHDKARTKVVKDKLDLIMLNRMTDEQITSISKAINYHHRKKYLNDYFTGRA